jgi:hypothetical protein
MESQNFYFALIVMGTFLIIVWFFVGRKGGYGKPTVLNLRKGESSSKETDHPQAGSAQSPIVQGASHPEQPVMRDVTPRPDQLKTPPPPPGPPPKCLFIYNGHDWDAFEVLGLSPYSSFSEATRVYQEQIKKADPGKHEFLQTAYMAILKKF